MKSLPLENRERIDFLGIGISDIILFLKNTVAKEEGEIAELQRIDFLISKGGKELSKESNAALSDIKEELSELIKIQYDIKKILEDKK